VQSAHLRRKDGERLGCEEEVKHNNRFHVTVLALCARPAREPRR